MAYDLSKHDGVVKHIMQASGDDVKQTLAEIKEIREGKRRPLAQTQSGTSRLEMEIPIPVYVYFQRKYGMDIWKDKKFREDFFKTFKAFAIADRW